MIKGVIFDLDGTLLNTLEDIKGALNFALQKFNYQKVTLQQTKNFIGNGGRELVERALKFQNVEFKEEVLQAFREYYFEHQIDFTKPYDDVMELLDILLKNNIKIAVASNKFYKTAIPIVKTLFGELFEVVVGSSDNTKLKPYPDVLFLVADKLNLRVDECLFVGDAEVDIMAAKNAKMKMVSVLWGYRSKEILEKLNPEYMVEKPLEILEIIDKENKND